MRIFIYLIMMVVYPVSGWAQEPAPRLSLMPEDSVLVIAPHPDDETIGAGGIIQEALRLNIPVYVMYLTNGDSNPLAFSRYKKRPVLGKKQALEMGKLRQQEAIEATSHLGLREEQLIFLSYPDYGTLRIFLKYWQTKSSYRSTLTRALNIPYPLSLTPGAGHQAQNVLADFKKVLLKVKPTKVFVTHPVDENSDHQAAYLFLRAALWDLEEQLGEVALYTYLVHAVDWPRDIDENIGSWTGFTLSSEQIDRKKEAIDRYRTQIPYKPKFLYSFVRPDELFSSIPDTVLNAQTLDARAWELLDQDQSSRGANDRIGPQHRIVFNAVVYGLDSQNLTVKIKLNQWSRSGFNINLYLFGYKKGVLFEEMPKYRVQVSNDHQAVVLDGQRRLRVQGVKVSRTGNDIFVSFPLSLMNDPDAVIGSAAVRVQNWPVEFSTWTVLRLKSGS